MAKATRDVTPPELRALEVLDHVPAGCRLQLVVDSYNAPHLRPGEFAVVDLNDRELVQGELYLIRWSNGRVSITQVKTRTHQGTDGKPFEGIWFLPLCQPKRTPDGGVDWSQPVFSADGPLDPVHWGDYAQGRVIGLYQGPETAAIEPPCAIGHGRIAR